MIERNDDIGATVVYIGPDWEPADASNATLVKLIFDDGRVLFLVPGVKPEPAPEPEPIEPDVGFDTHEFNEDSWARHRQRQQPRRIKINGQTLATWARSLLNHEMRVVEMAIRSGLQHGEDNTEIAHRVIGSRKLNGVNGATELTRQHILRLAKGYLRAKSRMSGSATE